MSETVSLFTVTSGERLERARERLSEALGGATLGDPDSAGVLSVDVDADDADAASARVRSALADSGTGDDFVLRETTEGREIAPDDPRQPGAGGEASVSTPAGEMTDDASDSAVRAAAGSGTTPPPSANGGAPSGAGGSTSGGGAAGIAKYAAPAIGGLLLALILRRLLR